MLAFVIVYPFAMAVYYALMRGKKSSEKENNIWSNVCIVSGAAELVAVVAVLASLLGGAPQRLLRVSFLTFDAGVSGGAGAVLGVVAAFAWFAVYLFSREYMKSDTSVIRYDFFNLLTLGATMGVFFAGDLFTLFFFFEIMSFTSFMWVAHRQTRGALYTAGTYLGISVAGGMAILMGLFIVYSQTGALDLGSIEERCAALMQDGGSRQWLYIAACCMLAGFGAKAGAFPVHAWLPKAYTEAPAPATALLSAVLSKTGAWGIWIVTVSMLGGEADWGAFVLVIGAVTMVYGGLRGVLSDNLKTTLAYSSMSQLGFIIVGIGMAGILKALSLPHAGIADQSLAFEGYEMASGGMLLHMLNHSAVKLVLFMAAGIVFMNAGSCELNRVRGFGRKKPFLLVTFLLAAAGIGGVPLLNGYFSKTMLHESITLCGEYLVQNMTYASYLGGLVNGVEYLFVFSGGLTVAYMIKLCVVLFAEKNEDAALQREYDAKKNYAALFTKLAMIACALPIPVAGLLPLLVKREIFSLESLSGAAVSIGVGIVIYAVIVRLVVFDRKEGHYRDIFPRWLDMERYVYRACVYRAIPFLLGIASRILDSFIDSIVLLLKKTIYRERALPYELPEGNRITHSVGAGMENIRKIYYKIGKKEYEPKDYEHKLALKNTDFFESLRIIERSLSFGLFMFCVGLMLTMIYLLAVN